MLDETNELIENFYHKDSFLQSNSNEQKVIRKSPKAKYQIWDELEFTRGREILGNLIVQGMITSGGTDLDWFIEHNGGFVFLEFKGFHNDKINIPLGQMIAFERLHQKLNIATKCYLYIVGCDDIDFSNPDAKIWIFEMEQWKKGGIPKNANEMFQQTQIKKNKFIVYREYMEETSVENLRKILDSHWNEFDEIN